MLQFGIIKPCHGIKELLPSKSKVLSGANMRDEKSAEQSNASWSLGTNHMFVTHVRAKRTNNHFEPKKIHSSSLQHFGNESAIAIRKPILIGKGTTPKSNQKKQLPCMKLITTNFLWLLRLGAYDGRGQHQQCQFVLPSPLRDYKTSAQV
ncbi:hypothetical protein T12_519 [Trichinella patagoniensis]|uniref:Uncharacterized protein n=1 Tax=Trichinella patagoniensis TaxID=990121 RepID=A0A0V0ZMF2_9BILA|nr:hypothetical protein T12_519 [Trichinella patagoniensis]